MRSCIVRQAQDWIGSIGILALLHVGGTPVFGTCSPKEVHPSGSLDVDVSQGPKESGGHEAITLFSFVQTHAVSRKRQYERLSKAFAWKSNMIGHGDTLLRKEAYRCFRFLCSYYAHGVPRAFRQVVRILTSVYFFTGLSEERRKELWWGCLKRIVKSSGLLTGYETLSCEAAKCQENLVIWSYLHAALNMVRTPAPLNDEQTYWAVLQLFAGEAASRQAFFREFPSEGHLHQANPQSQNMGQVCQLEAATQEFTGYEIYPTRPVLPDIESVDRGVIENPMTQNWVHGSGPCQYPPHTLGCDLSSMGYKESPIYEESSTMGTAVGDAAEWDTSLRGISKEMPALELNLLGLDDVPGTWSTSDQAISSPNETQTNQKQMALYPPPPPHTVVLPEVPLMTGGESSVASVRASTQKKDFNACVGELQTVPHHAMRFEQSVGAEVGGAAQASRMMDLPPLTRDMMTGLEDLPPSDSPPQMWKGTQAIFGYALWSRPVEIEMTETYKSAAEHFGRIIRISDEPGVKQIQEKAHACFAGLWGYLPPSGGGSSPEAIILPNGFSAVRAAAMDLPESEFLELLSDLYRLANAAPLRAYSETVTQDIAKRQRELVMWCYLYAAFITLIYGHSLEVDPSHLHLVRERKRPGFYNSLVNLVKQMAESAENKKFGNETVADLRSMCSLRRFHPHEQDSYWLHHFFQSELLEIYLLECSSKLSTTRESGQPPSHPFEQGLARAWWCLFSRSKHLQHESSGSLRDILRLVSFVSKKYLAWYTSSRFLEHYGIEAFHRSFLRAMREDKELCKEIQEQNLIETCEAYRRMLIWCHLYAAACYDSTIGDVNFTHLNLDQPRFFSTMANLKTRLETFQSM